LLAFTCSFLSSSSKTFSSTDTSSLSVLSDVLTFFGVDALDTGTDFFCDVGVFDVLGCVADLVVGFDLSVVVALFVGLGAVVVFVSFVLLEIGVLFNGVLLLVLGALSLAGEDVAAFVKGVLGVGVLGVAVGLERGVLGVGAVLLVEDPADEEDFVGDGLAAEVAVILFVGEAFSGAATFEVGDNVDVLEAAIFPGVVFDVTVLAAGALVGFGLGLATSFVCVTLGEEIAFAEVAGFFDSSLDGEDKVLGCIFTGLLASIGFVFVEGEVLLVVAERVPPGFAVLDAGSLFFSVEA